MANEKFVSFVVRQTESYPHLRWAEGKRFRLPSRVLDKCNLLQNLTATGDFIIPKDTMPNKISLINEIRLQNAFTEQKPISSKLPFSYQIIPPLIRSLLGRIIGYQRRRSLTKENLFPAWPIDLSVDFFEDLINGHACFWATKPSPVILTHDIDSADGLTNLVNLFIEREENIGARSTNYIVPNAWPLDHGILEDLTARGHELGIHGYDHSNLTPFCEPNTRQERLARSAELISKYDIIGYRAPSLLRTHGLFEDLPTYYSYDSSIPTSGGLFPVPNNGCASARPFIINGILEIPLSMPRDGSLRFLGHSPEQILALWINCAKSISQSGGVIVLLTHCESRFSGNEKMLDCYGRFLDFVTNSEEFYWSTPQEILEQFSLNTKKIN